MSSTLLVLDISRSSDVELAKLAEGLILPNTAKTSWTLNNFQQLMSNMNMCNPANPIRDIFTCSDPQTLNSTLSKFIVEIRKSNGQLYPPQTLHQLLCGVLRHVCSKNPACPNFMDKKDARFSQLHKTLDSYFHKLHSEGVGRQTKHAEVVTSDEDQLWKEGIMNTTTPMGLQNAAFLLLARCFAFGEVRNTKDYSCHS